MCDWALLSVNMLLDKHPHVKNVVFNGDATYELDVYLNRDYHVVS